MTKLTLSVNGDVVAGAKRYARTRGTSVSRLVESMLRMVAHGAPHDAAAVDDTPPPVLARLRGSLKRGSIADYRRYLAQKYR